MDSDGNIRRLAEAQAKALREQVERGEDPDLVEIPEHLTETLQGMNRKERRAWHAKERRRRRKEQKRRMVQTTMPNSEENKGG